MRTLLFLAGSVACLLGSCSQDKEFTQWRAYHGDDGGNAYSSLRQINKTNIKSLEVAWTYRSGDASEFSKIECNPIIIDTILYGVSPKLKTFALNAKTGKQLWVYDPFERDSKKGGFNRGLTYWEEGTEKRIFVCAGNRLIALDALTGKTFSDFGEDGAVDLRKGIREDSLFEKYDVANTSPGVVYKNLIIVGSATSESYNALPGDIRAYDVRTGEKKWSFHTIPHPGEFGFETWSPNGYKKLGGANAWSGLTIDRERGIVFAATGAPAFDFYGGERVGQNLFANCVLAIDAATGKYKWHFQTSHHDLWDYDLPSPPNLTVLEVGGKKRDVVVQITKQGLTFVLDRETGVPVFPVEERPVPASKMPGEKTWPTQPFPTKYQPLVRTEFSESIITDVSQDATQNIIEKIKAYSWGPIYNPPDTVGIIQMPGFRGGAEWSGAAIDPTNSTMYLPLNDIPNVVTLVELQPGEGKYAGKPLTEVGAQLYKINCAVCHGEQLQGNAGFPSLVNLKSRLNPADVGQLLKQGRGKMPSFTTIEGQQKDAIVSFLLDMHTTRKYSGNEPLVNTGDSIKRYRIKSYDQLLDQFNYPGIKPPWGMLCALNLVSGEIKWKIPLGEFPELVEKGIRNTGTQLFGGACVTNGGLVFIGSSQDEKFRAFDKDTGELLWEYQLPAGGYASPSIYEVDGKEFIVIAAGGGGLQKTKSADYYIAFALP